MAKRPRLASLAPALLAEEEAGARAHPLAAGLLRARAILARALPPEEARGLPERVLDGLAEALAEREAWELLRAFAGSPQPELARVGRIGIDRLRRRGVQESATHAAQAGEHPLRSPLADALMSRVDSSGVQVIVLAVPSLDGGMTVYDALCADDAGLTGFDAASLGRREWRDLRRQLQGEGSLGMTQVPPAYAHFRIEEEQARAAERGHGVPAGFSAMRLELGPSDPSAPERALAELPHPAPRPSPEEARALASHLLVQWLSPGEETVRALRLRWLEVEESQVIVNEAQRREAYQAVLARAVEEWAAARLPRIRAHVLEAACFSTWRRTPEDAARLRAQAEAMAAPGYRASDDPFLIARLGRFVERARASGESEDAAPELAEARTPGGLILP